VARRRKRAAQERPGGVPLAAPDPRDKPSKEYLLHHDIVSRSGGAGGKRVRSRLEQLLMTSFISAEQSEAGRRFLLDFLRGSEGEGGSCLSFKVRGNGDGHPSETRLDSFRAFEDARIMLDSNKGLFLHGRAPVSKLLLMCLAGDESFATIAAAMGFSHESSSKSRIRSYLEVLESYYESLDDKAGRSSTVHTKAAALKRFEPIDLRNPFTKED
jgi:hypothetical protein